MKSSAEKGKSVTISEFIGQTRFVESRLTDLLGAIPQDKLSWRPMEGVRSFAEVFEHITSANNGFAKMAGLEPSGESKMKSDQEKSETNMPDKQQLMANLKESFTNLRQSISSLTSDELNGQIKAFGMETSRRNFVVSTLNHDHEHLGQLIAYCRMNSIVPPWSK